MLIFSSGSFAFVDQGDGGEDSGDVEACERRSHGYAT